MATAILVELSRDEALALPRVARSAPPARRRVRVVDYESDAVPLADAVRGCRGATTLLRTDNRGFAAGESAAAATRAPFILLLNPDYRRGTVTRALESWMTAHPTAGVADREFSMPTKRCSGRRM
jgi:hypothetical protein